MQEEVTRIGRLVKLVRVEDGYSIEREQSYPTAEAAEKIYTLLMFDQDARETFVRNRNTKRRKI